MSLINDNLIKSEYNRQNKRYIRDLTESGDYYSATEELWKIYRESVSTDWKIAMMLEEGSNPDFYYDP